jgi:geranylgeranyl diphosphate synthase, type I
MERPMENIFDYFKARKKELAAAIAAACDREKEALEPVNGASPEILDRLSDFSCRGKMIRGILVSAGSALCSGAVSPAALPMGAAMELFQSALLIHDDIMDRDTTRRGVPTMHHRYALEAASGGVREPAHLGESLGICVGDIAVFLAFSLVAEAGLLCGRAAELTRLCSREMTIVGASQMLDVSWSDGWGIPDKDDVIRLYRYKTGRYTFSLPLAAGVLIAGGSRELQQELEKFGELLGIIFQIRDDELGLFGDEGELGKPVGSDIAEGKRTIFYLTMLEEASEAQSKELAELYGSGKADGPTVQALRTIASSLGVQEKVGRLVSGLEEDAREILTALEDKKICHEPWLSYLEQLLNYVGKRKS